MADNRPLNAAADSHAPVLPKNINNKYPKNNPLSIYPIPRPNIAEYNQFENSPE
jgi:hypothetical protein